MLIVRGDGAPFHLLVNLSGGSGASPEPPPTHPTGITGWSLAFDASDPAAFGGSLPGNGDPVTTTSALYDADYALAQYGAAAVPTYAEDAGGSGIHGLRFTAAESQVLTAPGMAEALWSGDMDFTWFRVVITAASLSATQCYAGMFWPENATGSGLHQNASYTTSTACIARYAGTDTGVDVLVSGARSASTKYINVLQRWSAASSNPLINMWIRADGQTQAAQGGVGALTSPHAAADMRMIVGARAYNSALEIPFDGHLLADFYHPTFLDPEDANAMLAWLGDRYGIAVA